MSWTTAQSGSCKTITASKTLGYLNTWRLSGWRHVLAIRGWFYKYKSQLEQTLGHIDNLLIACFRGRASRVSLQIN